jgi:hypothetical protein
MQHNHFTRNGKAFWSGTRAMPAKEVFIAANMS